MICPGPERMVVLGDLFEDCPRSCPVSDMNLNEFRAALERARVVGVLDAWVKAGRKRWVTAYDTHLAGVELGDGDELGTVQPKFEAATLDAARAAAAKAIESGEL